MSTWVNKSLTLGEIGVDVGVDVGVGVDVDVDVGDGRLPNPSIFCNFEPYIINKLINVNKKINIDNNWNLFIFIFIILIRKIKYSVK